MFSVSGDDGHAEEWQKLTVERTGGSKVAYRDERVSDAVDLHYSTPQERRSLGKLA